MRRFLMGSVVAAVLATTMLTVAGCGGGEPEERTFEVKLERGTMAQPDVIKVKQGDTITLNIATDEPWFFHVHGYEVMKRTAPGEVTVLTLEASATGSFTIGLHKTMPAMPGMDLGAPQFADLTDYELEGRLEVRPR